MIPKLKVKGDYISFTDFIKAFCCENCGDSELTIKYISSNSAIQVRCKCCGKFYGNVKYDEGFENGTP